MTYTWDPTFCISVTCPENVTEDQADVRISEEHPEGFVDRLFQGMQAPSPV